MTVAGMEATNNTGVRNQCREQEVEHLRTLMSARSALMSVESVPILQCKRDVVGVRRRSPREKGLYSEDVHRHGRRNQVLSRARQSSTGSETRSKEQG
jgi:hypothetical protein